MIMAWLAPDPEAQSLRADIISQDVLDVLAYALAAGEFTSVEVHRDATPEDILHGNGRVTGHFGSSNLEYYPRRDDPEWAVVFHTDCPGDTQRGRTLLKDLLQQLPTEEEEKEAKK